MPYFHCKTNKRKWAAEWQTLQDDMCAERRLRSAWAFAKSDQSFQCPIGQTVKLVLSCCSSSWYHNPTSILFLLSENVNTWWVPYFHCKTNQRTWAGGWQNLQDDMCAQRKLRSAWAFAQSDQSFQCPIGQTTKLGFCLAAAQTDITTLLLSYLCCLKTLIHDENITRALQ